MSTENFPATSSHAAGSLRMAFLPPAVGLNNGDRMSRREFHRLYEQTPDAFKAELIGGVVYVASPVSLAHSEPHALLLTLLTIYAGNTPGLQAGDNATVLLGDEGEPQPDAFLRILPDYGGQSTTTGGYVDGPPEFIAEVAYASQAIDLHAKKDDYARYGVREYVVVCVKEGVVRWFDLAAGAEKQADAEGICRIGVFPGLWINGPALIAHDYSRLMASLQEGLATDAHAAFARELASRVR